MKRLNELTIEELKGLYAKNKWLQTQGEEYRDETAYFWVDEYLHDIPKRIDYRIEAYNSYMYIAMYDYADFVEYCDAIEKDFGIFYEYEGLIKRLLTRTDFYRDCVQGYEDISDDKFDLLNNWMTAGVEMLKDHLVECLQSEYEVDPVELLDCLIENIGDDYETDGEYIYELNVRKYA